MFLTTKYNINNIHNIIIYNIHCSVHQNVRANKRLKYCKLKYVYVSVVK